MTPTELADLAALTGAMDAKTAKDLNGVDDEWLKHRAACPDEVQGRVDRAIAAARAELKAKG